MVLGHGLVFHPVLATLSYTQTRTYNSGNIITLQIPKSDVHPLGHKYNNNNNTTEHIDITDFPSK